MRKSKLPKQPSLEYLKKLAKNRLQELRRKDPEAKLTTAQLDVAREYGFSSWRALKAHIDGCRSKKITSPVMRSVAVADIDRSIAFYRDVLGFKLKVQADGADKSWGRLESASKKKDSRPVTGRPRLPPRIGRPVSSDRRCARDTVSHARPRRLSEHHR